MYGDCVKKIQVAIWKCVPMWLLEHKIFKELTCLVIVAKDLCFLASYLALESPFVLWYVKVILHSQVEATLTIYDAWLDLQAGFVHLGKDDGRPTSSFFPLVISPSTKAGILFGIRIRSKTIEGEAFVVKLLLVKMHV